MNNVEVFDTFLLLNCWLRALLHFKFRFETEMKQLDFTLWFLHWLRRIQWKLLHRWVKFCLQFVHIFNGMKENPTNQRNERKNESKGNEKKNYNEEEKKEREIKNSRNDRLLNTIFVNVCALQVGWLIFGIRYVLADSFRTSIWWVLVVSLNCWLLVTSFLIFLPSLALWLFVWIWNLFVQFISLKYHFWFFFLCVCIIFLVSFLFSSSFR